MDEVGRGALAGPVVAAAVVLPAEADRIPDALAGVRDSKQLDGAARCRLFPRILDAAAGVGIGAACPATVDTIGIARAGDLAMMRALARLPSPPDCLLVDGFRLRLSGLPQRAVVRGDQTVLSIAAASIVAKVYRDAWMIRLGFEQAGYAFEAHKGYGTADHLRAIHRLGATVHHRLTWAPLGVVAPLKAARPPRTSGSHPPRTRRAAAAAQPVLPGL